MGEAVGENHRVYPGIR